MNTTELVGTHVFVLIVGLVVGALFIRAALFRRTPIRRHLQRHFGSSRLEGLVIAGRKFHARIRADLQKTIDQFFVSGTAVNLTFGIQQQHPFFGVSFSELLAEACLTQPVAMEYEDVDIGEGKPVRCAVKGLWLLTNQGKKYAVLMSPIQVPGEAPLLHVQVAAKNGDNEFSERLFAAMEKAVQEAVCYRGNPYDKETEERRSWEEGWRAARKHDYDESEG